MSFLLLFLSLTGLEEESPINMEQFQATVDRFTDLKKTLSFPEHESPGTSPQLSRRTVQPAPQKDSGKNMNKKSGMIKIIYMKEPDLLFSSPGRSPEELMHYPGIGVSVHIYVKVF